MRHYKTSELQPLYDSDGLTEEDRVAIAKDREADRVKGEINPYTLYCEDCEIGPFGNRMYRCPVCSRGDW